MEKPAQFRVETNKGGGPKLPKAYLSMAMHLRAFDEPVAIEEGPAQIGHAVERIILQYEDGTEAELPQEQSQQTYYVDKIVDTEGASLWSRINPELPRDIQLNATRWVHIALDEILTTPDTYFVRSGHVRRIDVQFTDKEVKTLRGNARIEASSFSKPVRYENVVTGENFESDITDLPIGPRKPRVGGYYFLYFPLRYFYCAGVSKGLMDLYMVESFQNAQIIQARFTQETKYIAHYIPLSDRKIEQRLHDRLQRMQTRT